MKSYLADMISFANALCEWTRIYFLVTNNRFIGTYRPEEYAFTIQDETRSNSLLRKKV